MKKKIKIIDLLCKINCDEEVPYKIRYDNKDYTYDSEVQDYWDDNYDYLFEKCFREKDTGQILETEIEILDEEDEFEDIEQIEIKDFYKCDDYQLIRENFKLVNNQVNQLIKNQKKIIERLNNE